MSGPDVDVRVGIVSWNTAPLLRSCLAALPAALDGLRWEVVVVDNDSADDSAQVAEAAHPDIVVLRNESNLGYARAMNRALAGTSAPALLALNPDTAPEPGSLARLVRDLERLPAAGLVVPRLLNPDGSLQHSVHRFPGVGVAMARGLVPHRFRRGPVGRRWWLEGFAPHDRTQVLAGAWAIGAVHCIRREALGAELPYGESWFMYTEDMDLCWRLQQRAWDVVLDADVEVAHVGNAAAERAWTPWEREERILRSTYGWERQVRGVGSARRLAVAELVGAAAKLGVSQLSASAGSGAAKERLGELRRLAAFHARQVAPGRAQTSTPRDR